MGPFWAYVMRLPRAPKNQQSQQKNKSAVRTNYLGNDKMANDDKNISVRKYADHLGISDKAVRNAIKDGKIKKGVAYKTVMQKGQEIEVPTINQEIADKEWGDLHKTDKIKPGQKKDKIIAVVEQAKAEKKPEISPHKKGADMPETDDDGLMDDAEVISRMKIPKDLSFGEATRRREIIGLALDKKKLQELERELVRRDEVERNLFAIGVELKKKLLNVPARVTSEVRGAATEVEAQSILTVEITQILNEFSNLQEVII